MSPSTLSCASKSTSPPRATATALVKRAPRRSSGTPAQLLEEQEVAVEVGGPLAPEAARVEPGRPAEGVDREPRVVGHGQPAGEPRVARAP